MQDRHSVVQHCSHKLVSLVNEASSESPSARYCELLLSMRVKDRNSEKLRIWFQT